MLDLRELSNFKMNFGKSTAGYVERAQNLLARYEMKPDDLFFTALV